MSKLAWPDLIIDDISPDQFRDWLAPWAGIVVGRVSPLFLNKFGFFFLRRPEGHVEVLDVFTGQLDRAADSYDNFVREVNEEWWQEVYLLSELVFQLRAAGKVPGPGQCYALGPHPALFQRTGLTRNGSILINGVTNISLNSVSRRPTEWHHSPSDVDEAFYQSPGPSRAQHRQEGSAAMPHGESWPPVPWRASRGDEWTDRR